MFNGRKKLSKRPIVDELVTPVCKSHILKLKVRKVAYTAPPGLLCSFSSFFMDNFFYSHSIVLGGLDDMS